MRQGVPGSDGIRDRHHPDDIGLTSTAENDHKTRTGSQNCDSSKGRRMSYTVNTLRNMTRSCEMMRDRVKAVVFKPDERKVLDITFGPTAAAAITRSKTLLIFARR